MRRLGRRQFRLLEWLDQLVHWVNLPDRGPAKRICNAYERQLTMDGPGIVISQTWHSHVTAADIHPGAPASDLTPCEDPACSLNRPVNPPEKDVEA